MWLTCDTLPKYFKTPQTWKKTQKKKHSPVRYMASLTHAFLSRQHIADPEVKDDLRKLRW